MKKTVIFLYLITTISTTQSAQPEVSNEAAYKAMHSILTKLTEIVKKSGNANKNLLGKKTPKEQIPKYITEIERNKQEVDRITASTLQLPADPKLNGFKQIIKVIHQFFNEWYIGVSKRNLSGIFSALEKYVINEKKIIEPMIYHVEVGLKHHLKKRKAHDLIKQLEKLEDEIDNLFTINPKDFGYSNLGSMALTLKTRDFTLPQKTTLPPRKPLKRPV